MPRLFLERKELFAPKIPACLFLAELAQYPNRLELCPAIAALNFGQLLIDDVSAR